MSIMACDRCTEDTDKAEMETYMGGGDNSITVCPACAEVIEAEADAIRAEMYASWLAAPLSERDPEEYRRQMIEAGRGHLLPPG